MSNDCYEDDKENAGIFDNRNDNEASLYDTSLPNATDTNEFNLFEDHYQNSLDSGYAATNSDSPKDKRFYTFDDSLLDFAELSNDENTQLPDFNNLMKNTIKTYDDENSFLKTKSNKSFKRSVSMMPLSTTSSEVDNENSNRRRFKRLPSSLSSNSPKRAKILQSVENILNSRTTFTNSVSFNEDSIKSALQRESTEPDLIGDFTKEFCLPLVSGRHQDLKSITPTTLALLMKGEFKDTVTSFKVIDCRYPYEYNGGHISGAVNLYMKQQILDELLNGNSNQFNPNNNRQNSNRHILVFHCEFSSERGPNLSRFLRNIDRMLNKDSYPFLHYPEIYLLHGGYKMFYEQYSELCIPDGYLPMLHPGHGNDLKHFRTKSKTFNCDNRLKVTSRNKYM